MVRTAPPWLVSLLGRLADSAAPVLWLGPRLAAGAGAEWVHTEPGETPPSCPERYECVCVAGLAADQPLAFELLRLRSYCAPSAVVCVLLPELVPGIGAKLARWRDPLGRRGRMRHPLTEMCAALLGMGASAVTVERGDGLLRAVHARMPAEHCTLDDYFLAGNDATE